jgi:hypothetical protein
VNWRRLWRFLQGPTIEDMTAPIAPPELPSDRNEIAGAAKRLLQDPVFALALDRVERRLYETWRQSAIGDSAKREQAYQLHCAIEELKAELHRMVPAAQMREPQ